jgi:uncharacterized protein YndB with AHSA1/START domain
MTMPKELTAEAPEINAPASRVWQALTDPAEVKQHYFGTDLKTDWRVGSPMTFSGEWNGKPYEDLGTVTAVDPPHRMAYSHWSPLSGTEDAPENRHNLEWTLDEHDGHTHVTLAQDNNANEEERQHSSEMWGQLLAGLKQHIEGGATK